MACPPTPVSINLIVSALAVSVPVLIAWMSSKLESSSNLADLSSLRDLDSPLTRRKLETPVGDGELLVKTLKDTGYVVAHEGRYALVGAKKGDTAIEFRRLESGTYEASMQYRVSDTTFKRVVKSVVADYCKQAQARAAERFRQLAPKFGLEVTSEKGAPGKAIEIKAEWVTPQRQMVKVAR
jgi:hypothetical protein